MPTIAGLIGATVEIGSDPSTPGWTGIVRGVLVDASSRPVLLRVELAQRRGPRRRIVFIPCAALDRSDDGILHARPHVLLGSAEAAFYVGRGFEWVSRDDVSSRLLPGIVAI